MTIKKVCYIIVFVLLIVFAIQNIALIHVHFLFWEFTLPRSVMLFITFITGVLIGFGLFEIRRHKKTSGYL